MKRVYNYIDQHSAEFIEELVRLVRQPSVSASGEGIQECADMVENMLREAGFTTKMIPQKDGNLVVYGELKSKNPKKTLLFYDHYDVQPPEPLEEWMFEAFNGEIHEGRIYGRGVSDNKGNFLSRLKAVGPFLKQLAMSL